MLSSLHIENIAVIEKADLDLTQGFNVLTGETGAGKSILIDSINLALGERVSKDIVRTGARTALVSALFCGVSSRACAMIESLGYESDGDILIQREISADGRGSCRISGRPATVSIVRQIGRILVNIHGQHDNQALLSPENHIHYLDKYAQLDEAMARYGEAYQKLRSIQAELAGIETDDALKERKIDLLKYQIDEIESADLAPDEEDELRARKLRIVNAERIASAVSSAYEALGGGDQSPGAQELVSDADAALDEITEVLPPIGELAGRIKSLCYELEDCTQELRYFLTEEDYDPQEIDTIEQRLDTIFRLKKKYGGSVAAILSFLSGAKAELASIETSDERAQALRARLKDARKLTDTLAADMTEKRRAAAQRLCEKVISELRFLDMPQVTFAVAFEPLKEPGSNGCDRVEFMIAANPGSPARPLAKIASGGEISRVMLAIKTVLSDSDGIDTLIFDEIDTGVSGRAAQKIGTKLRQVSENAQVLCVTHLAQIAAQADTHILIEKQIKDANTFTMLKPLDYEGRKHELARIIGAKVTEQTLDTAAEMLSLSGIKECISD